MIQEGSMFDTLKLYMKSLAGSKVYNQTKFLNEIVDNHKMSNLENPGNERLLKILA